MIPADSEIIAALQAVSVIYGRPFAARIEELFRNETAHFKSGNFQITLSPGMQATTGILPYGWNSLAQFWKDNPGFAPTGIHIQNENTSALAKASGAKQFMVFPTIMASIMTVAKLISLRGGDAGTWFSTHPDLEHKYDAVLDTIIPKFVYTYIK